MKTLVILLLTILSLASCKIDKSENKELVSAGNQLAPVTDEMLESAIIYEINIRQYSPEGSFDAFAKDIPQLRELGVKIIWMMPIFPISETKRKATGGNFASLIEDEAERKKALGSYYAVSDFTKVNPEFGTIEDFRNLVKIAHDNGIYVILDWVPNHTGWDHAWLQTNPEFYTKNAEGEITDPLNDDGTTVGWADVADLNYDSAELRIKMVKDMNYWLAEENIDGFRCDVAGSVPTDFWQEAIPKLRAQKDIFMLAEAWEPELLKGDLFDMAYAWGGHHVMNAIAKGEKNANDWNTYMQKIFTDYEANDMLMNFITNHDENSWSGTVKERFGDASETMLALSYMTPGMPLIYSGQEYGLNHQLKFFEKDSIPKTKGKVWDDLEKLGKLKTNNVALNGGKKAASYKRIKTANENILLFSRSKENQTIVFVSNFSDTEQELNKIPSGNYLNYMSSQEKKYSESENIVLEPWGYKILIKK
ncbi:MAG: alpha-amylase [Flavobacteriaceae bacterium]|nr:alpha-amylase [Flavobacteriaceae bacterium]